MRALILNLTMLGLLVPGAARAANPVQDEAAKLIESGKAEAAYQLLDGHLGPDADAEFDYLYGIAALDAGRAGVAVFAFERVLAAKPDHVYARAELGRALLQLGEYEDAVAQFRRVRELGAPVEVTQRLDAYEAELRESAGPGYQFTGYLAAMFGYDSNYNSATGDGSVTIPAFGDIVFTLDQLFQEDDSLTAGARGGMFFAAPFSERSTFVASLELEGADYPDADVGFFYVNLRGNIGVSHQVDANDSFTVAATGFSTWVTDLNYLKSLGVLAAWRHQFDERDTMSAFLRVSDLNYDEVIEFRDVRQYLSGVTLTREEGKRWSLGIGVFGGAEIEVEDSRPDVGRELYGARAFGSYALGDKLVASASVSGQFSDYRGEDGLFLRTRDDEQFIARAALAYTFAPKWTLRPEVRYTNNSSNIPTSDYERVETLVYLRRDFN